MYRARFEIDVVRRKKEPTEDGLGYRWVNLPVSKEKVELEIDVAGIVRQLGERAALSKGRRAKGMNGAVLVKVVK